MDNKNLIGIIVIVIVIIILGYFLFFRSKSGNDGNIYPPPAQQQSTPGSSEPTPSDTLQPNPPTNLQNQGTTAPGPGGQIQLNPNANSNTNAPKKTTDATIKNMAFSPAQITVPAGSTVRWTNQDSIPHTVTADNGKFNSGNLSSGNSFEFTFTTPGTYSYHCSIHPNMKGTIVVQ